MFAPADRRLPPPPAFRQAGDDEVLERKFSPAQVEYPFQSLKDVQARAKAAQRPESGRGFFRQPNRSAAAKSRTAGLPDASTAAPANGVGGPAPCDGEIDVVHRNVELELKYAKVAKLKRELDAADRVLAMARSELEAGEAQRERLLKEMFFQPLPADVMQTLDIRLVRLTAAIMSDHREQFGEQISAEEKYHSAALHVLKVLRATQADGEVDSEFSGSEQDYTEESSYDDGETGARGGSAQGPLSPREDNDYDARPEDRQGPDEAAAELPEPQHADEARSQPDSAEPRPHAQEEEEEDEALNAAELSRLNAFHNKEQEKQARQYTEHETSSASGENSGSNSEASDQ
jgi:hypothetical protein